MTPTILLVIGIVLVAGSLAGMFWCADHPEFGTIDGACPHWTTWACEWLWAPALLGFGLVFGGFACLAMGVGL